MVSLSKQPCFLLKFQAGAQHNPVNWWVLCVNVQKVNQDLAISLSLKLNPGLPVD